MQKAFSKYKSVILYGASLAALLFLMRRLEYRYLIISNAQEVYTAFIAVIFMGLGVWLTLKLAKPKKETVIVEKEVFVANAPSPDLDAAAAHSLSKRETEVLALMGKGMSNAEIADTLFVSLSTVKTHSGNIYEKLGVKRRTQAVEKAKQLAIID
ncbi:response regulator transcription factor [Flavobacterium sp. RHBU_24]|uniref:response regulator transcription factor n=1 Tax=Flavobacterium sp. RHBU_24 TaxID=3391185 RepID=UPI0039849CA3